MIRKLVIWAGACVFGLLTACSNTDNITPIFHAEGQPATLSEWGILDVSSGELKLAPRVLPYDLNTPLFSDYSHKLRTVWMPEGAAAHYDETQTFEFPVGTIISKTFYYPKDASGAVLKTDDTTQVLLKSGFKLEEVRLIETRLLIRRDSGWAALPYVWNADQSEATLKRAGDLQSLSLRDGSDKTDFTYVVPNANQCAGCHATNATTKTLHPIGPRARHLNREFDYTGGTQQQLTAWEAAGYLDGKPDTLPKTADWQDKTAPLDDRARAYLAINCAHCHNPVGPADTSGLNLEPGASAVALGRCKLPIAAGQGTGGRLFDIVPGQPDASIFTYRLASTDPAAMMPELGRALAHREGVALIRDWIDAMDGGCAKTAE